MQGDTSFRNETRDYFCPGPGIIAESTTAYYNDMATLLFNSQEIAIKQLFHQNGTYIWRNNNNSIVAIYLIRCIFFAHPLDYIPDILLCRLLDIRSRHPQWSLYPMHYDWRLLWKIYRYHFWV